MNRVNLSATESNLLAKLLILKGFGLTSDAFALGYEAGIGDAETLGPKLDAIDDRDRQRLIDQLARAKYRGLVATRDYDRDAGLLEQFIARSLEEMSIHGAYVIENAELKRRVLQLEAQLKSEKAA